MKSRIQIRRGSEWVTTAARMRVVLQEEWNRIAIEEINALIQRLPTAIQRYTAVGGPQLVENGRFLCWWCARKVYMKYHSAPRWWLTGERMSEYIWHPSMLEKNQKKYLPNLHYHSQLPPNNHQHHTTDMAFITTPVELTRMIADHLDIPSLASLLLANQTLCAHCTEPFRRRAIAGDYGLSALRDAVCSDDYALV